jgi:hypothetical protein
MLETANDAISLSPGVRRVQDEDFHVMQNTHTHTHTHT